METWPSSSSGQWRGWVIRRTRGARAVREIRVTSGDRSALQLFDSLNSHQLSSKYSSLTSKIFLPITPLPSLKRAKYSEFWALKYSAPETKATLAASREPRPATARWKKLRSGKWAQLTCSHYSTHPEGYPINLQLKDGGWGVKRGCQGAVLRGAWSWKELMKTL